MQPFFQMLIELTANKLKKRLKLQEMSSIWKMLLVILGHVTCTFAQLSDSVETTEVTLDMNSAIAYTDRMFLSVAIGTGTLNKAWRQQQFDIKSKKLLNLGAALSPCSLRIGGTDSAFLIFDPYNNLSSTLTNDRQFTMTVDEWDQFTTYARDVGWDIMFDFNIMLWKDKERTIWDPSNAKLILDYSAARNIAMPLFQLGNEVSSYKFHFNVSIPPKDLVRYFRDLKALISNYPLYKDSKLVGPDLSNLQRRPSARTYMDRFMKAGAGDVINYIGQHQYYLNAKTATEEEFMMPSIMNTLDTTIDYVQQYVYPEKPGMEIWLTETSSAFSGGAVKLSDRYVAGFLWLDKLGLSARRGVTRVFRQTFYASTYALIDYRLDPTPDYFLSVMYKRLVEGSVFNVTFDVVNTALRVYAHCARQDFYGYPPGAVVFYYLNTKNTSTTMNLTDFKNADLRLFHLTPSTATNLASKYVNLNGVTLTMTGDELPTMNGAPHRGLVTLTKQSFGFIVVPDAKVSMCGHVEPTTTTITTTDSTTTSTTTTSITLTTANLTASTTARSSLGPTPTTTPSYTKTLTPRVGRVSSAPPSLNCPLRPITMFWVFLLMRMFMVIIS